MRTRKVSKKIQLTVYACFANKWYIKSYLIFVFTCEFRHL